MILLVVLKNGQKKYLHLTADAGAGNPVGSLLHTYKKSNPSGYLYCDGSTFDQTKYPLLYAYLGTNVLPDYREAVEVGAEQNTTDTIATHDVYTEGQFKDDQLQNYFSGGDLPTYFAGEASVAGLQNGDSNYYVGNQRKELRTTRRGTTTHGKQKAVFVYIKATSGLSENAQDNVINTLNEERSYSTEEVNTGKKWIDGKVIYRKTFNIGNLPNNTAKVVNFSIQNLNDITKVEGIANTTNIVLPIPYTSPDNTERISVYIAKVWGNITVNTISDMSTYYGCVTIEYTKTTN